MIECSKCQHDNDLGRIFCVKCGEKLDISKVRAPSGIVRRSKEGKKNVPAKKMVMIGLGKFIKVAILAVMTAMITLICLPPHLQQESFSENNLSAFQEKRAKLEEAVTLQQEVRLVFEEADLNAYLSEAIQKSTTTAKEPKGPSLENIYIGLGDGVVTTTIQEKWRWFRFSVQMRAKTVSQNDKWQFRVDEIRIGRWPIPSWFPPQAKDSVATAFKVIWKDLSTERQWLEDLSSLEIKPKQMILVTKKGEQ